MTEYGRRLEFGISLVPDAADLAGIRAAAVQADGLGLDLLGLQDHPYQARFLETWSLIADLLARTERLRVFPDVANLPLRLPAMIAKQAASLDVLSGGRFELGLGAGAFWEGIEAMGGPARAPRESVEALEEAIRVIRLVWSAGRGLRFDGEHYRLGGLHAGPAPAHPIGIWVGAYKPRMLELTGRLADGWVPSSSYAPPETIPDLTAVIDAAAREAGREPSEIRRVYNVMGSITDVARQEGLVGPASMWVARLTAFALELGFDTFVFWPSAEVRSQVEAFARDVVPAVREAVEVARGG